MLLLATLKKKWHILRKDEMGVEIHRERLTYAKITRLRNVTEERRNVTGPMEKMMHGAENAARRDIWVLTVHLYLLHEFAL